MAWNRLTRLVVAGLAACIAAILFVSAYEAGLVRLAYPDRDAFPVRGVDVSHHQGVIDWRQVATDDVRFAYIKATEGGDWRDRRFAANHQGAAAAGLRVGAYHFFTLCRPGRDQARNHLAAIGDRPLDLAPAVDLEFGGNCSARPTRAAFEAEALQFLKDVETATGRRPLLYVTREFYDAYVADGRLAAYPIWLRDLVGGLSAPQDARVEYWQFAARGRVQGVTGPVDLNVAVAGSAEPVR